MAITPMGMLASLLQPGAMPSPQATLPQRPYPMLTPADRPLSGMGMGGPGLPGSAPPGGGPPGLPGPGGPGGPEHFMEMVGQLAQKFQVKSLDDFLKGVALSSLQKLLHAKQNPRGVTQPGKPGSATPGAPAPQIPMPPPMTAGVR